MRHQEKIALLALVLLFFPFRSLFWVFAGACVVLDRDEQWFVELPREECETLLRRKRRRRWGVCVWGGPGWRGVLEGQFHSQHLVSKKTHQ